ncbi:MAG: manganese-dependent inorganic pyrophosphatase [Methanothrix sp.]|nr:manganese-dependent inorganic pyrophosphatase [Methanothrix sp.]OPX81613.1 MAG: Manganese-dependent inorganic pyrophosphatase [Methanosaeta sp. PtaB.Bin087]HNT72642.1 manganese-dependent inorganic pyrophosphatase [Methanothrix sp.]HOI69195.1 manganese-dependent inorganic pyrophosphatase [Methanothrix sp.]HPY73720.1 manganese-dependent inorganic pyrophosphatase [Methanothrix sp.]
MFHLADNVYVVGHKSPDTDSVAAAISYANLKNQLGMPEIYVPAAAGTINAETKFVLDHFSVPVPETITDGKGKKIVLVDHNEVGQAVENIKEATILEVIDHHKIGDITTPNPIFFHNEPVGSTATIVSAMYDQYKVPISREMAGVMISAILSDTVLFKSPTCTAKDKEEVAKLAKITGEDFQEYGIAMLTAKSDISSKTAMDIVKGDYKHFDFAGTKAGVGQIEVMDLSVLAPRKKEILETMEKVRKDEGLSFVLIMLTDVMKEASDLLFVGSPVDKFEKAFAGKMENNSIYKKGVLSRKKQVIPPLEAAFK